MMVRVRIDEVDSKLTKEELEEIAEAGSMPIAYDEDSPMMTEKMLGEFHAFDSIPIRVSRDVVSQAKKYDKDYVSFLSRLLDMAFHDNELVKKCIYGSGSRYAAS